MTLVNSDYFFRYKELEKEYTSLLNKYLEIEKSLKRYNLSPSDLLSVEKLNQFLYKNKTSDVIWLMDLKGKSTFVSSSIQKFTGYTEKEYLAQTIPERFMPESAQKAMNALMIEAEVYKKNLKSNPNAQFVIELEYRCKDGSTKWGELNITPVFDEDGNFVALNGITKDISEQIKTRMLVVQQEEQFVKIMDHLPGLIFIHQDGKLVYANISAKMALGIDLDSPVEFDVFSRIKLECIPLVREKMKMRNSGETIEDYKIEVLNASGVYRPVIVRTIKMNYQFKPSVMFSLTLAE